MVQGVATRCEGNSGLEYLPSTDFNEWPFCAATLFVIVHKRQPSDLGPVARAQAYRWRFCLCSLTSLHLDPWRRATLEDQFTLLGLASKATYCLRRVRPSSVCSYAACGG